MNGRAGTSVKPGRKIDEGDGKGIKNKEDRKEKR